MGPTSWFLIVFGIVLPFALWLKFRPRDDETAS